MTGFNEASNKTYSGGPPDWDLSEWYPSVESFETAIGKFGEAITQFQEKFEKLSFNDPDELAEAVQAYLDIEATRVKLTNFLDMMRDVNPCSDYDRIDYDKIKSFR